MEDIHHATIGGPHINRPPECWQCLSKDFFIEIDSDLFDSAVVAALTGHFSGGVGVHEVIILRNVQSKACRLLLIVPNFMIPTSQLAARYPYE
jgi:hypothetical protein